MGGIGEIGSNLVDPVEEYIVPPPHCEALLGQALECLQDGRQGVDVLADVAEDVGVGSAFQPAHRFFDLAKQCVEIGHGGMKFVLIPGKGDALCRSGEG